MWVSDGLNAGNDVQRVEDRTKGHLAARRRAKADYTKILKEDTELACLDLSFVLPDIVFNNSHEE
jgi:hypothetical protein